MNRLVEFLAEHYDPGGNAFKIAMVPELLEKSGFTVEDVFNWALEASREKYVLITPRSGTGRWGTDRLILVTLSLSLLPERDKII